MRTFFQSIVAASLFCVGAIAFAGGPAEPPPPEPVLNEGVYIDLAAGFASVDWVHFGQGSFDGYSVVMGTGTVGSVTSNGHGGFTYGFDAGYQVNKYFGIEGGWFDLPTVKGTSDVSVVLPSLRTSSWFAYLALKLIVPITDHFQAFAKVGGGYRSLKHSNTATTVPGFGPTSTNYISGVAGGGLQYWFGDHWTIAVQDLYMFKNTSGGSISRRAPGANLVLGSVGYRFGVVSQ